MYCAGSNTMHLARYSIQGVNRPHPVHRVGPNDFVTGLSDEVLLEEVICDPRFSLYCVDPKNDRVLLVEVSHPEVVDRAPFYYQAQVEHAIGLVSMPTEVFHEAANQIAQPENGLIFIHSVGRCGSTLLSKVFAGIPTIHSLSEPDDLTQLVELCVSDRYPDNWLKKMILSSVRWRGKARVGSPPEIVAIKTRSEVLVLADLVGQCFPAAKHLFLYRNGVSWMQTMYRNFSPDRDFFDQALNQKMEESWARTIPLIREVRCHEAPMNPVQIRMLAWISCMEAYIELRDMGVPTCAVRFEDLCESPEQIIKHILHFCDICDCDWDVIRDVLSRDSQAGSIYDREKRYQQQRELSAELVAQIKASIATRALLRTPEVILPGTLPRRPE